MKSFSMLREKLSVISNQLSVFSDQYLSEVIAAMRDRVSFVKDFVEKSPYFFWPPKEYDPAVLKKRWKAESPEYLKNLAAEFSKLKNPPKGPAQKEDYEAALKRTAESLKVGNGELIHPLRLAISGMGEGPGFMKLFLSLGRMKLYDGSTLQSRILNR